jgi:tetratricopeptide (TPR) repeat protein
MPIPTVFISYSHLDEEWKDRVLRHLSILQQENRLDLWDDRRIEAGEEWYSKILEAINAASVAILLISTNFLSSQFILDEEVPRLLQRREKEGIRVIPLIITPCAWLQVGWMSQIQARPKDGRPLSNGEPNQIENDLAAFTTEIAGILKRSKTVAPPKSFVPLPPDRVFLAKLPSTNSDLFGREKELAVLNEAWQDAEINILTLVAWGGVGKSALVNKWLNNLGDSYRGAERVFGWSFYSQGAAEGRQVSADPFIAKALEWFGDEDPSRGSPWDKGERLADLIKRQRTLLIVDGLEPLQNPPPAETGRIRDPALSALLRELARRNPGLVVVTTRLGVDDLKDFMGGPVRQIDLENLSLQAGAEYLQHLGVGGEPAEREQAALDFDGHALALTLLGSYLRVVHHGDIRQRSGIEQLTDEKKQGLHARRVMTSYEKWLAGKPELDILYLMGLFDRPVDHGALEILRARPFIEGLTDTLQTISDLDWQYAVDDLRALHLLAIQDPGQPGTLDCHPLVREHFGRKLKENKLDSWKLAQGRLFDYYKAKSQKSPSSLDEMAPLYLAVAHGCQAQRYQEALIDIYWQRIQRGRKFFSKNALGAFGSDLSALAGFFMKPWHEVVPELDSRSKSFVYNDVGAALQSLGRSAEAVMPLQTGLETDLAREDLENAAISAGNLSELLLVIGDLKQAHIYAERSVEYADRGRDDFQRMVNRSILAEVLYQTGQSTKAEETFAQAEEIQTLRQPQYPFLYSLAGFRYCEFLLNRGDFVQARRRAAQTLHRAERHNWLLNIALDNITLGRAALMEAQNKDADYSQILEYLERGVQILRQARAQNHLPRGLIARAKLRSLMGEWGKAEADLEEAVSIARRGGMRLFEADCYLELVPLYKAVHDLEKARKYLALLKKMKDEMSYHRLDTAVAGLVIPSSG